MANHASAEKRNRQRVVTTERNRAVKSALRTALKKARAAVADGDENAAQLVKAAQSSSISLEGRDPGPPRLTRQRPRRRARLQEKSSLGGAVPGPRQPSIPLLCRLDPPLFGRAGFRVFEILSSEHRSRVERGGSGKG